MRKGYEGLGLFKAGILEEEQQQRGEGCWQCGVKYYAFLDRFGVTGCFPFNEGRLVLVSSFCIRPYWIMTVNIRSVPATGTTTDNHSLV